MIKKLKKTDDYKWIHQDRYDKWFENCEFTNINKLQIPNFVDECLSDAKFKPDHNYNIIRFTCINRQANICNTMFESINYYESSSRRLSSMRTLFITKGCIFVIPGWFSDNDLFVNFNISHRLVALHVLDNAGKEKVLIDPFVIDTAIGKKIKSAMNSRGMSSRKNAISFENLDAVFTEFVDDFDNDIPFEKTNVSYLESKAASILEDLKANLEEDIIVEEPIVTEIPEITEVTAEVEEDTENFFDIG